MTSGASSERRTGDVKRPAKSPGSTTVMGENRGKHVVAEAISSISKEVREHEGSMVAKTSSSHSVKVEQSKEKMAAKTSRSNNKTEPRGKRLAAPTMSFDSTEEPFRDHMGVKTLKLEPLAERREEQMAAKTLGANSPTTEGQLTLIDDSSAQRKLSSDSSKVQQREKGEAARTFSSDFEFAFNLQLEEAIKASLALHESWTLPSSTASASSSQSPPLAVPMEESRETKTPMETCRICFEDIDIKRMFFINGCGHRFCYSCMKHHAEAKLLNGMLPYCPHEGCKSSLKMKRCSMFLDPQMVDLMNQLTKEASIPVTDKVYCPYPKCSNLMSKDEALEYTKRFHISAELNCRQCNKCNMFFCSNCMIPWHHNLKCNDYQTNVNQSSDDAKLKALAATKRWRQCVRCRNMVELARGCYHITCRCGHEFCYACGAEWKDKKPTCSHPIWEERYIIHDGRREEDDHD